MSTGTSNRPRIVADGPLSDSILEMLADQVVLLPWKVAEEGTSEPIDGIYTYGHPSVCGDMMDRLTGIKIISNFGVGVDHIDLAAAAQRGIPVGNTPGVLDAATADMAWALLMAAGRRLAEGDRYARCAQFTRYDPSYMLGQEVHGATLGIFGLGRIGWQIAKRAKAFEMRVLYHNRSPREDAATGLGAEYVTADRLLRESDYVVLSVPLTDETRHMIDAPQFELMKPTATLVNAARGPVINTNALYEALTRKEILAAAVDVTDPEPLPRDHPLLSLENIVITPHLGSATVQTRQRMAEISVRNLLSGLAGKPLTNQVRLESV